MKQAYVFPGQGAQFVGMGKDLYENSPLAKELFEKANDILVRLGAGINYEAGIISDQLDSLYNYMSDKVIEANYKKDVKIIEEVISHLAEIATAWHKAMQENKDAQPKAVRKKTNAYEQNMMYED